MRCPACPGEPPPGAAFCPRCGARCAPAAATPEERRVVTVVFCDLVGSTGLSTRLDPEDLRAVTLRYFAAMREQLEAHGGTVEKYIGDAVMSVFGVPVRHEDDARRALAAALGMTEALAGLNAELARDFGIDLAVRIGVNTGEVIAVTDPSARQALVSGEVVNVAARLEQAAGAGEILIGPATADAAGPAAVTTDAGTRTLRGTAGPITPRRLLRLRDDDPELTRRFDTPFVGRAGDLGELTMLGARLAADGHARLATVHGEAGLGKTRLLREWLRRTPPGRRPLYGVGRCRPYGETGSLLPLGVALRQVLDQLGDTPQQALADVPERDRGSSAAAWELLRGGLLADGSPSPSLPDTGRALICLLTALTRPTAGHRPVLLVLDDLQWAADPLLDLVGRLLEELSDAPLGIVCAARPALLERRPSWGGGLPRAAALTLTGLRRAEAAELAAALGTAEVTAHQPGEVEQAVARAEGNPLYLEHLLATPAAPAAPAAISSRNPAPGPGEAPPPTVQAVLGARVDALPAGERALLQLAAVLGREFRREALAALAAAEPAAPGPEELAEALRGLLGRRLLEPVRRTLEGSEELRFASGLVRETVYLALAKSVRARHHERAAAALAAGASGAAAEAAVGGHLERAYRCRAELGGDRPHCEQLREQAAEALHRAGVHALSRADLPWAQELLTRARALRPGSARVARRLAEVRAARGAADEARELLIEAHAAAAGSDPVTAAHAELGLAVLDARPGTIAAAARRTLPVFTAAGDDEGIARAGVRTAHERQRQGRHGEAEALLRRALDHARRADAEPERAMALGALGISLWRGPLPVPRALERCRRLRAEHGAGRPVVRATLGCPSAVLLALAGEAEKASATLEEAGRLARELGYAEAGVFVPLFGAELAAALGRWDEAVPLLDAAARAAGGPEALPDLTRDRARALLELGDPAPALALSDAPPGPRQPPHPPAEAADVAGLRARALALTDPDGARAEARALAGRALAAAESTDSPLVRARTALDLAHTLASLGERDRARTAAGAAVRHHRAKGDVAGAARAAGLLARLDAGGGR